MNHGDLPQTTTSEKLAIDNSYGFFLYFFDEVRGHIPLFTFPKELMDDEDEKEIVSLHSIWWHQDKFIETDKFNHMDLELRGVNYSATLILCQTQRTKKRSGMKSKKWQPERFVLIVRTPSSVSFIAHEILHEVKKRIQGIIGGNLCFLVENYLRQNENSEIGEFFAKKAKEIKQQLTKICSSLIPKIPISMLEAQLEKEDKTKISEPAAIRNQVVVQPKEQRKLRFSIPTQRKKKAVLKEVEKPILMTKAERVKILRKEYSKQDKSIQLLLYNKSSKTIDNALVKIFLVSQGFFGKDVFVKKVKKWAPKEEVSIEYQPINENGNIYFLKIEDEHGLIKVKRILG